MLPSFNLFSRGYIRALVLLASSVVLATAPAYAQEDSTAELSRAGDRAVLAGIGDSVSTHLALSSGLGAEANPLVNTSPAGLIALAGAKWGLVKLVEGNESMTLDQKKTTLNLLTSAWTGVSVNNLLIALGASGPAALAGLAGSALWTYAYTQKASSTEQETTAASPGSKQELSPQEAYAVAWTAED